MADRLTQLQDAVNVQAENLCNSIGLLQQCSRPTPFPDFQTFQRSPSTAYKQVLIDAGIPIDIDDMNIIDNNNEQNKNENIKNGHDNNINNNNNNNNTSTNGTNTTNNINKNDIIQQQNGDNNINNNNNNNDELQQQQQLLQEPGENSKFFAKLITKTAKDIDLIIDSLPSREMETDLQEAHIKVLEIEDYEEAKKLEMVIKKAEKLLDIIKMALEDIAQNQMRMKQLEAQMLTSSSSSSSSSSTTSTTTTTSLSTLSTKISNNNQNNNNNALMEKNVPPPKSSSFKILHSILDDHHHSPPD